MHTRGVIVLLCLCIGGCASRSRDQASEARGYDRGLRQAVKEQYWLIQNVQRHAAEGAAPNPTNP